MRGDLIKTNLHYWCKNFITMDHESIKIELFLSVLQMLFSYLDGEDVWFTEKPFHWFLESFPYPFSTGNESHEKCGTFHMPAEKKWS